MLFRRPFMKRPIYFNNSLNDYIKKSQELSIKKMEENYKKKKIEDIIKKNLNLISYNNPNPSLNPNDPLLIIFLSLGLYSLYSLYNYFRK